MSSCKKESIKIIIYIRISVC